MADQTIADETPRTAGELTGAELLLLQLLTSNYSLELDELKSWIVSAIVDTAPSTLDTLNELAAALGDDPNFAATMTTALAGKQPLDSDLTAIAALVSAANKFPYATGSGTWTLADLTAAGRAILDDADNIAQRETLGLRRPYVSGRWYIPGGLNFGATGSAFGSDLMKGFRGEVRDAITLDQLGVQITTLAASGNFQIAVYAQNATTLAPTGAPVYSSSSITTGATGAIADSGPNVALAQGFYWFFVNVDTTGATTVFRAASSTATGYAQSAGAGSLANALSTATGMVKSQTFNTWPTLTGNFATDSLVETSSATIPMIAFSPA